MHCKYCGKEVEMTNTTEILFYFKPYVCPSCSNRIKRIRLYGEEDLTIENYENSHCEDNQQKDIGID